MTDKRVLIITGLSGSGKSSAASVLEDEGFFVVDNLPLAMLPRFLELTEQGVRFTPKVAVVIDIRNRDFLADYESTLNAVRQAGHPLEILFFEASDPVLIRRYSETRRRHPLARQEGVLEGITRERELMAGFKRLATKVFDTSALTVHQLRDQVQQSVLGADGPLPLMVKVQSFGFRYGIPVESDLVFDVRFLPNPHFIEALRPQTGLNPGVRDYVLQQEAATEFLVKLRDMLGFLLPHYRREGKSYLTISIGCTGGRHRSVSIAEVLRPFLAGQGFVVEVGHRDIEKR
ncbi:RNase adapter RapZ [Geoalkalibacter subterraneus]|uniref:GlmZ(SRNA)-inactivating NTPase n=1 Tax=Geoalkalibacter subterraneus TaxID=483547 RepID=A0A0B5FQS0_9BACT|nr:RNase adapter RapZ [Geoalkalibacter subterraneus]AJF06989.1 glmZ(sRNA)-inactivating NTPase [Geoalkalibacter subterraneus]